MWVNDNCSSILNFGAKKIGKHLRSNGDKMPFLASISPRKFRLYSVGYRCFGDKMTKIF